jgi:hypothetical protein
MLARAVGEALSVSTDPHEVLQSVLLDVFWSEFSFGVALTDQLIGAAWVGRDVSDPWREGV